MPLNCSYNCVALSNHEKVICGRWPKGGVGSVAILECNHLITDFTNAAQWQTGIDTNTVTLIEPIKGIVPQFSEVNGTNPVACGSENILDGFDATITWNDYNVSPGNDDFYNELNQRQSFIAWYECSTDRIRVVEVVTSFMAKIDTPESNREKQFYPVVASWSTGADDGIPPLFTAPDGIFSQ